jgi:pseudouridine synthase
MSEQNNESLTKGLVRLNKFIADSGYTSRRKADELIAEGRVSVNSVTVTGAGTKVDPLNDTVKVDGESLRKAVKQVYILLNKPAGYITSTSDEKNRDTVLDLVKVHQRIYPVGRLDYDTEGLLLLTNDGELANKLMHPKYEILKTYLVKVNKPVDSKGLERLTKGVMVDGRKTSEAKVQLVPNKENKQLRITIHEGRNRQVKKMLESVGLFVRKLKRIEYGGLNLKGLRTGEWRYLSEGEVKKLKQF